jgi:putative membrane protein
MANFGDFFMQLLSNALRVTRLEAALFRNFPKLRLSVVGIVLIPALYAFIYLTSVWDPANRTAQLPAVIVNLDQGTQVQGKQVLLGAELAAGLKAKNAFGFRETQDPELAKREVREGKILFALIVPPDFSAQAMGAAAAGAGKLVVYASEGNNYAGAGFARRFAAEVGHQLNETLNEKRWEAVLGATASSADSLTRLREGVAMLQAGAQTLDAGLVQAHSGSTQLSAGIGKLSDGVSALGEGVKQLGAGARTLDSKKPAAADLQSLKAGAAQLASGHADLQKGLVQLEGGAGKLVDGATQMREQTKTVPIVGAKISVGAGQLADGATQLRDGLQTAAQGEAKLAAGSQTLAKGVDQLADGFGAYSAGVSMLAAKFPADAQLDELSAGGATAAAASTQLNAGLGKLQAGSTQLHAGLQTLGASLPQGVPGLPGTAKGLAASVEPEVQIDAPVTNQGQGLAPNFIPVSLWLGAVMTAFIFHLRRLPEAAMGTSRPALLLGKMGVLGSINLAQAGVVFLMSAFLLDLHPTHAVGLGLTMAVASLTFMLVILFLVRALGDAGKAVALVLLILQLSSAGGVMPVELTNEFFRAISPWLPFTWAVRAVRASTFGAFGNEWATSLGVLALFGLAAFSLSMFVGRWKFVSPQEHRPAMDI